MIKNITKFIDTLVSNILCLSKAKQSKAKQSKAKQSKANKRTLCQWKEVQLFSNCTFDRKESEGLSLCSSLFRGAFLC